MGAKHRRFSNASSQPTARGRAAQFPWPPAQRHAPKHAVCGRLFLHLALQDGRVLQPARLRSPLQDRGRFPSRERRVRILVVDRLVQFLLQTRKYGTFFSDPCPGQTTTKARKALKTLSRRGMAVLKWETESESPSSNPESKGVKRRRPLSFPPTGFRLKGANRVLGLDSVCVLGIELRAFLFTLR